VIVPAEPTTAVKISTFSLGLFPDFPPRSRIVRVDDAGIYKSVCPEGSHFLLQRNSRFFHRLQIPTGHLPGKALRQTIQRHERGFPERS